MRRYLLRSFKKFLTIIGASLPTNMVHQLQLVINYMKLGRWMVDNGFRIRKRLPGRTAVFQAVADVISDSKVLYLEFGVHKGASMRFWSNALTHEESKLRASLLRQPENLLGPRRFAPPLNSNNLREAQLPKLPGLEN